MKRPFYHTRHIPRKHILSSTPMGAGVIENGLCDLLSDEKYINAMKQYGIDIIETRIVWEELEEKEGHLNWDRLDHDIDQIERNGFGVGIFPWFQHPPKWETNMVRAKCLEHKMNSSIISLWEPKLLETYDRLYHQLFSRYGNRINFLYVGIYGDYGEVLFPSGVKHYYFSPEHGHIGFWCADVLAKSDFVATLRKKYSKIEDLNSTWQTNFTDWQDDLFPKLPIENISISYRIDFVNWYTDSLASFTDKVCKIARRYFSDIRLGLPMGSVHENTPLGQIKSLAAKTAAKYNITARWTGLAHLHTFGQSNTCSRRISSAARFYGTSFGTEAALKISKDNAANAIYESLANGAEILHNDPGNILRAEEIYQKYHDVESTLTVLCKVAVFYPLEGEQFRCLGNEITSAKVLDDLNLQKNSAPKDSINVFYNACESLRKRFDFELADSIMIKDGFLHQITDIIFPISCPIPSAVAEILLNWKDNGGKVWVEKSNKPWILETKESWPAQYLDDKEANAHSIFYISDKSPVFEQYDTLSEKHGGAYITLHNASCYSFFNPITGEIGICDM